jgi:hypothetical protein
MHSKQVYDMSDSTSVTPFEMKILTSPTGCCRNNAGAEMHQSYFLSKIQGALLPPGGGAAASTAARPPANRCDSVAARPPANRCDSVAARPPANRCDSVARLASCH